MREWKDEQNNNIIIPFREERAPYGEDEGRSGEGPAVSMEY